MGGVDQAPRVQRLRGAASENGISGSRGGPRRRCCRYGTAPRQRLPPPRRVHRSSLSAPTATVVSWWLTTPATGTERWRVPGGFAIGGGTAPPRAREASSYSRATTGNLYAYSADKGEKLLELKVGISGGMAPPITFMVDGKQYVALQVGQGAPGPGPGGNTPPPNPSAPAPKNPRLLVYALDGTAQLP